MRFRHWLFTVSVLLFVSGIAFIIAAERTRRSTVGSHSAPLEVRAAPPVATVRQLMTGMIGPSAQQVWDSVSVTVSDAGTEEKKPRTDEEWARVAASAATLVEASTLLLQGNRAVDTGDWQRLAREMAEASSKAIKAADSHDAESVLTVGETIYNACTSCHEKYLRNQ